MNEIDAALEGPGEAPRRLCSCHPGLFCRLAPGVYLAVCSLFKYHLLSL
jgi:hypothetical protein